MSGEAWISCIPEVLLSFLIIIFIFSVFLLLMYQYQVSSCLKELPEEDTNQFETLDSGNVAHFFLLGKFRHLKVLGLELKRVIVLRLGLVLLISFDYVYLLTHLQENNQGWDSIF